MTTNNRRRESGRPAMTAGTKVEIWFGEQCLGVIEDAPLKGGSDTYDDDLKEVVNQWSERNLYPRLIEGDGLPYSDAVAVYDNIFNRDRRLVRFGDPSVKYSEKIGGTWFLSTGDNLLAWVDRLGEITLWGEQYGFLAEELTQLWEIVQQGKPIPDEIVTDCEDGDTEWTSTSHGILTTARRINGPMTEGECECFQLPVGSTCADAADRICDVASSASVDDSNAMKDGGSSDV